MITAAATAAAIAREPSQWRLPLMELVDDVRRRRAPEAIATPADTGDPRLNALLAATIESLCSEQSWAAPDWVTQTPPSPRAWFVSGFDSLRAIALAESPLPFRLRRLFVLENFLSRA